MFCSISTWWLTILIQKNCAFVILKDDVFLNIIVLRIQEASFPKNRQHEVVDSNNFLFFWYYRVELLLRERQDW